jgi:hypothetical protein
VPIGDDSDGATHWREGATAMALRYYLRVKEHLDDSWSSWFDGLSITHTADGATTLEGSIRDQSALYGLIDKLRDLGLTLLAVGRSVLLDIAADP